MKIYSHIIDGHTATIEKLHEHAMGIDWTGVPLVEQERPTHSEFIDEKNGIGIYYDYGADYYFFTDETEEAICH